MRVVRVRPAINCNCGKRERKRKSFYNYDVECRCMCFYDLSYMRANIIIGVHDILF